MFREWDSAVSVLTQLQAGQRWDHVSIPGSDESSAFQNVHTDSETHLGGISAMLNGTHYVFFFNYRPGQAFRAPGG